MCLLSGPELTWNLMTKQRYYINILLQTQGPYHRQKGTKSG